MQLGSPASTSPAQNSYLPNFLMGIENTPTNRSFCKLKLILLYLTSILMK